MFRPTTPEEFKTLSRDLAFRRFEWVDKQLAGKQYLMGDNFTLPDAYLYVMTRWAKGLKIDLSKLTNLQAFAERVGARPKVQQALKEEGLKLTADGERLARCFLSLELHAIERGVTAVLAKQFVVAAGLHDLSAFHHQDAVGMHDGREPVRDHQRRASLAQLGDRLLHVTFGFQNRAPRSLRRAE